MTNPRAVLVGCGGISRTWLRAIQELGSVDVVALVDIAIDNAAQRAEDFGLENVLLSDDLEETLRKSGAEVVFNCTVPAAHFDVTMMAIAHGCHVLTEKPLAESMEQARIMIRAAEDADRLFAVIQNRRYVPQIRQLRHMIDVSGIGPITTVDSDFYVGAHFGGFREHMKHVLLLDMAIHTFDAARYITGENPSAVYCREWNPAGSWYDQDASAVAVFEMTNGIIYTYRGSWCAEGHNTSWESEWRIVGRHGTILWDGNDGIEVERVSRSAGLRSEYEPVAVCDYDPGAKEGRHLGVIREFLACVRDGGSPETVASDNIMSLAMVLGAVQSAEEYRLVQIRS